MRLENNFKGHTIENPLNLNYANILVFFKVAKFSCNEYQLFYGIQYTPYLVHVFVINNKELVFMGLY